MVDAGLHEATTLWLVFLAATLEKLLPIMPPYGLLVGLGARLAATGRDLALLTGLCAAGSTFGSWCWYQLGAWIGPVRTRALVLRHGWMIGLTPRRFISLCHLLGSDPFRSGVLIQLVPVLRFAAAVPAGLLRLPPSRFFTGTALGASIWSLLFLSVGWAARATGAPVEAGLAACASLVVAETIVAAVIAGHLRRRRAGRRAR